MKEEEIKSSTSIPSASIDLEGVTDLSKLFFVYNQSTGKKESVSLSESQKEIFEVIVTRGHPRVHVMTTTQFGKSFVVALATLLRAATKPEKWAIVAPTEKQAKIIMGYILEHVFDNPLIESQLIEVEKRERLKSERSKKRITFKRGGEIFILSADTKNKRAMGDSLMGFGAPNLILDESSLIPDEIYAKIFRMLGGHKDNFILEIGNPFRRNHFLDSYRSPRYKKIVVDWRRAVTEGRLTQSFVDEMKEKADFSVLYGCQFPEEEELDTEGWFKIFLTKHIEAAFRETQPPMFNRKLLGVDASRGGHNETVWVIRTKNHSWVELKANPSNLNEAAALTIKVCRDCNIPAEDVYVDATGVGGGLVDALHKAGWIVNGVNMANRAIHDDKFINIRAEAYMLAAEWLKAGNSLLKDQDWYQLEGIKAQVRDSSGKWQIMSKLKMRENGMESPDVADAFMLTFCGNELLEGAIISEKSQEVEIKRRNRPSYE